MEKTKVIKFITGNKNKAREVNQIIANICPDVHVEQLLGVDIPEVQADPDEIVREKLKYARKQCKEGIIVVEDTSLCFNALNGLPGPYIKTFLEKLGLEKLSDLGFLTKDNSAYAQCIFGLSKEGSDTVELFSGITNGKIVKPRGPNNFGWDPIFEPDEGKGKTYAEMDKEDKNKISHRFKALKALAEWLNKH